MDKSKGYYILYKTSNAIQPYYFVLVAPNHEVILKSEMYTSRDGALNGIESTKINCPYDKNYDRLTATNGNPYFNLRAENRKIIGTSEMYSSEQMRDKGIEAVKKYGTTETLIDKTGTADNSGKPVTTNRPERSGSNRYA